MSLKKQLWTAISIIIILAFLSGFIISGLSARNNFKDQILMKNIDNATVIAASINHLEKDIGYLDIYLTSVFDNGHYSRIQLDDANDQMLILKESEATDYGVPRWFQKLMEFDVAEGVSNIQDGWNLFGKIRVKSEYSYVVQSLWSETKIMFFWYLVVGLVCCMIGSFFINYINNIFKKIIVQMEMIGNKQFVKSEETNIKELKPLMSSMNSLSDKVKSILDVEAQKLDSFRRKHQVDEVTGVANRSYFMSLLSSRVSDSGRQFKDAIVVVRIQELEKINKRLQRLETDKWLNEVANTIKTVFKNNSNYMSIYYVGRIRPAEFACIAHDCVHLEDIAKEIAAAVTAPELHSEQLLVAASYYSNGDDLSSILQGIDMVMSDLEYRSGVNYLVHEGDDAGVSMDEYHALIESIKQDPRGPYLAIHLYPVRDTEGNLYHQEAMMNLSLADKRYRAGDVIGYLRKNGLMANIDFRILELALEKIEAGGGKIAINISDVVVNSETSFFEFEALFDRCDAKVLANLMVEIDEMVAVTNPISAHNFVVMLKKYGISVGLQAVGVKLLDIVNIDRYGFNYIKIAPVCFQDISASENGIIVSRITSMAHAIECFVVADGVKSSEVIEWAFSLGVDAVNGPGVNMLWKD